MGADAGLALVVGSALFLLGGISVVVLCRMALREGAEFEAEITARSLRLKVKPSHHTFARQRALDGGKRTYVRVRPIRNTVEARLRFELRRD